MTTSGAMRAIAAAAILSLYIPATVSNGADRVPAEVDGDRIVAARDEPESWLVAGGDYQEQRFSALDQISQSTVSSLGMTWFYDIPTQLGQEATPVVVDGIMYVSTDGSVVKALDARTGSLLWSYDPLALAALVKSCCGPNSRGVAVWKQRVYVGALDGRLIALDAASGKPVWSVMTVDQSKPYTISGVARIVNGKVIIGNSGAELGVRGYVTAYDAETGRQLWRFYTVPGDPNIPDRAASDGVMKAKVRETWTGEFWRFGGGGTVWDSMAYDPELNLLYIGVGNGSPWNPGMRSPDGGDNLFLSSIIALDPDDGKYRWHYQTTPAEAWDYTATQSIILADIEIAGRLRHVLMQAPKNGFFYLLDRQSGELLSAEKFAPVTWASSIDLKTGRPIENPDARYYKTNKPALVQPGSTGAHNWQAMAFSPLAGLAYIPVADSALEYVTDSDMVFGAKKTNVGVVFDGSVVLTPKQLRAARTTLKGWLAAWDPVQGRELWRAPLQHHWNGGALATAGDLVFQGNGAGELVAYGARDGKRLWAFDAQTGIVAAPMSYAISGQQYIAVMAGWGGVTALVAGGPDNMTGRENGPNRLLVFKLGASAKLPPLPTPPVLQLTTATTPPAPASAERGARIFGTYCFQCHSIGAVGGGLTIDLRYSATITARQAFAQVVVDGALENRGMSSFGDVIGAAGAEDVRAFLIERARVTQGETEDGS